MMKVHRDSYVDYRNTTGILPLFSQSRFLKLRNNLPSKSLIHDSALIEQDFICTDVVTSSAHHDYLRPVAQTYVLAVKITVSGCRSFHL